MKKLPQALLQSLEGIEGYERQSFEQAHARAAPFTSIRINPQKCRAQDLSFDTEAPVPWCGQGVYLRQRPSFTFDPFFHAGCYYVQEASSMFLEQAFVQLISPGREVKVLDLCAAPGGKSTHIQSLLPAGSMLVSNEVIRSRVPVLTDNIIKWGASNVWVSHNDPAAFQKLKNYFDVMVVDAPCSGSGLFRKDPAAIEEWSLNHVALCAQRQRRILADALPALKEHGILIYSTCSYSKEEDEENADWLVSEMGMESVSLNLREEWNIVRTKAAATGAEGYRFFPDKLWGEGFYIACFRKTRGEKETKPRPARVEKATAKEQAIISAWINREGTLLRQADRFYFLPAAASEAHGLLASVLNLTYCGVEIGQIMKDKLVPAHALAMSGMVRDRIPVNELEYEEAIRYLQRNEMNFNSSGNGWQLVSFRGRNLGWINVLPNRINNYYPKEIRILKQSNDRPFEK